MAAIARQPLELAATDPWGGVVAATLVWARSHRLACQDVVVLLPFAQLLPLARRAFGSAGGWMPRVETTQTLAFSRGPAERPAPGQLSFDAAADCIVAERMLRAQTWATAWARTDARAFSQAAAAVVETAHALAAGAFYLLPADRAEHWERGRALLSLQPAGPSLPGARERLLGRVALEWAAAAPSPASDALFSLRPAGWVVVQAGGGDTLSQNVLAHAPDATPCLWLNADVDAATPFDPLPAVNTWQVAPCGDFEDEAQRSAACVLQHLHAGEQPVALIAQDRVLVRRVRALLARRGVAIQDETGWKLSTTRAGASLRALLTCVRSDASSDDWLDWLKACLGPSRDAAASTLPGIGELEATLRKGKWRTATAVDPSALTALAVALWRSAEQALGPLKALGPTTAVGWLAALQAALQAFGQWTGLEADDAGRQVLAALHLTPSASHPAAVLSTERLDLDNFIAWLDNVLERASFLPESPDAAQVVITPLARAMLRPFSAAVFPGADERHFGTVADAPALLGEHESAALGLPSRQARRDAELCAFAQLLRLPQLTLLHRTSDEGEPRAASPWVQLLGLALRRARPGASAAAPDPRIHRTLLPTPIARPQPKAPDLLPQRLSASACEALRACPYRFFVQRMLRLNPQDELAADLEKREYGTWLHAVLQRFHVDRVEPAAADAEAAHLHQIGRDTLEEQRLDEAEFLPYSASFARLVPRYVTWLHERDVAGAKWLDAERRLTSQPPEWGTVEMHGVIDRLDYVDEAGVPTTQLIDYKTGQAQALRDAIRRSEDTQLPFYAALMAAQGDAPGDVGAMYLMLDESDKIQAIPHGDVRASASALVAGVGHDLSRLRAGASLPALGEGRACEFCDARGLCRRDHWPATTGPTP